MLEGAADTLLGYSVTVVVDVKTLVSVRLTIYTFLAPTVVVYFYVSRFTTLRGNDCIQQRVQ